ncbi:MAG: UDP-N-acetylglucosamine--N-acetylmuramyl-(pentapeptide) pyrophosphoryl-undecaprenol N-acetylglucosamine transferase [Treponemataceae bacterium]
MKKYIAFTGGGTGGHIYPGLAIADFFKSSSATVTNSTAEKAVDFSIIWIGNNSGIDKTIVSKSASVDIFCSIPCGKLRRYFSFQNFFDFFKVILGFFSSFFILLRYRPAFLFSKGGFVSVPPCFAARLLKIPVYTHECDFSPGLATRLNAKVAKTIFLSYEQTKKFFNPNNLHLIVTGNPIRQAFYSADKQKGLDFLQISHNEQKPILLILGGSGGAKQINDLIIENISWLCERFTIVHQTGKHFDASVLETSSIKSLIDSKNYLPYEFIFEQMCDVLACADIVVTRSGANALWEAAICHKPMLLIPLSGSGTRGDQVENARFFAQQKAAFVLEANQVNSEKLQESLLLMKDKTQRQKLIDAVQLLLPKENPAKTIFEILHKELISNNL